MAHASLTTHLTRSSLNVINARRKANKPILPALLGLIPFFMLAWLFSHHEDIVHLPAALPTMLYLGIAFAYTVGTIIICHVSKMTFPTGI